MWSGCFHREYCCPDTCLSTTHAPSRVLCIIRAVFRLSHPSRPCARNSLLRTFLAWYSTWACLTVRIAPTKTFLLPCLHACTQIDLGLPFYAVPHARHPSSHYASSALEQHARPEGHVPTERGRSPAYTAAGSFYPFVTAHQPARARTFGAVLSSQSRPLATRQPSCALETLLQISDETCL